MTAGAVGGAVVAGSLVGDVVTWLGVVFIAFAVLLNLSFVVLTVLAMLDFNSYRRKLGFAAYDESFAEPLARGVSVLMPAHNEERSIVASVKAMTSLRYPDFEVVVIDDGSTDATAEVMIDAFDMVEFPLAQAPMVDTVGDVKAAYVSRMGSMNLLLVRKANGGKADALNVGIDVARKELVVVNNAGEALLTYRELLDDPGQAEAIGTRARERVLDEHTYAHRAKQLLSLVDLDVPVKTRA